MLILFFTLTVLLAVLPFVPALRAVQHRAAPLHIAAVYEEDLRHAAERFEADLHRSLDAAAAAPGSMAGEGRLPFRVVLHAEDLPAAGEEEGTAPYLLPSSGAWTLPAGLHLGRPLFATQRLRTGLDSSFHALFAAGDLLLAPGNTVQAWLHGKRSVVIASGCRLHGSASAGAAFLIEEGCAFERIHAPEIYFGMPPPSPEHENPLSAPLLQGRAAPAEAAPGGDGLMVFRPPGGTGYDEARSLVRGDLTIPAHHVFGGSLVVTGRLRVEAGVRIVGSIKAYRGLVLGPRVEVRGNVFCERDAALAGRCRVQGAVVAEGDLTVEAGCMLGAPGQPVSISGRRVRIAPGTRVCGTVWALEQGTVRGI